MDYVNVDNRLLQLKRSSFFYGFEMQINLQLGLEMNKDDLDVSLNWQGFFQVDLSYINLQKILVLFFWFLYLGENDMNIIENFVFVFDVVRIIGDRFN